MLTTLALFAALALQTPPAAQDPDGPIATGGSTPVRETAEALRSREAIAYAYDLPRGAPSEDYPLVAWCDALVSGHVKLGESLTTKDALDLEIVRLGKLEAEDFRTALATAAPRQRPATRQAADEAAARASAMWTPLLANEDEQVRSQAFGLFFGLPGRCEHAARRIRDNITTPPATPKDVGLE